MSFFVLYRVVCSIAFLSAIIVFTILWIRNRKSLSEAIESSLPQYATKFEGVKAWWSSSGRSYDRLFTNLETFGSVVFDYNKFEVYIEDDRMVVAGKAPLNDLWGKMLWMKPLVIHRKEGRTYSPINMEAVFISSAQIADDLVITFWNYSYNKKMKMHIKGHQDPIRRSLATWTPVQLVSPSN